VTLAVREGWSPDQALAAMTSVPAELFGIGDRVGSLQKGRDADLVILSGEPFAPTTRVRAVMVDGEMKVSDKELTERTWMGEAP
jgi:imidazolonepropionase-like amidohydrolase